MSAHLVLLSELMAAKAGRQVNYPDEKRGDDMAPKKQPKKAAPVKAWCLKTREGVLLPASISRTEEFARMWRYKSHGDTATRVEVREV